MQLELFSHEFRLDATKLEAEFQAFLAGCDELFDDLYRDLDHPCKVCAAGKIIDIAMEDLHPPGHDKQSFLSKLNYVAILCLGWYRAQGGEVHPNSTLSFPAQFNDFISEDEGSIAEIEVIPFRLQMDGFKAELEASVPRAIIDNPTLDHINGCPRCTFYDMFQELMARIIEAERQDLEVEELEMEISSNLFVFAFITGTLISTTQTINMRELFTKANEMFDCGG